MRSLLCLFLGFVLIGLNAAASPGIQQDPTPSSTTQDSALLTNKDVMEMIKSGLTAEVVVAKIRSSRCNFDTSPAVLAELKAAEESRQRVCRNGSGASASGEASRDSGPIRDRNERRCALDSAARMGC
jgi:hypothetical protein